MNLLRPEFSAAPFDLGTPILGAYAHRRLTGALVERLLCEPDERLGTLRGVFGAVGIVLIADADALPWLDGLVYLRACSGDATVWVPSTSRISLPEAVYGALDLSTVSSAVGTVLALPGHTDGSLVVVSDTQAFVGDLFRGSVVGHKAERHFYMCDLRDNDADIRALLDGPASGVETFFTGHFGPLDRAAVEKRF